MRALCIVGSPHSDGATGCLVDKVIEGLTAARVESVRYTLGDLDIRYCQGCKHCCSNGKCIQHDDMQMLAGELVAADIVLVASPSYWGNVPGQLKVFIDRSLPWCDTVPGGVRLPEGKKGIAIALRAGRAPEENLRLVAEIEHYFSHLHIKPVGRLTSAGVPDREALMKMPQKLNEAYELGLRVGSGRV